MSISLKFYSTRMPFKFNNHLIFVFPNKRIYTNTHNVNLIKILFN